MEAMDTKDKCEYFKYLSTCHREILQGRFAAEWRTLTFTLAFYVLPIATIFHKDFSPPNQTAAFVVLMAAYLAVAVVSIGFLRSLHNANSSNRDFAERAEDAIDHLLIGKEPEGLVLTERGGIAQGIFRHQTGVDLHIGTRRMWAWWWEVAIIIVFAVSSSIVVLCKMDSTRGDCASGARTYGTSSDSYPQRPQATSLRNPDAAGPGPSAVN
jgi:hypothetical protein